MNLDKSCAIIINSKKKVNKLKHRLNASPLYLCGKPMKLVEFNKYFWDYIGSSLKEVCWNYCQEKNKYSEESRQWDKKMSLTTADLTQLEVCQLVWRYGNWLYCHFFWIIVKCWIQMSAKYLKSNELSTTSFFQVLYAQRSPIHLLILMSGDLEQICNER